MHATAVQYALWILQPLLQCVVAIAMINRGLWNKIPVFWSYTVFHVLLAIASYLASQISYSAYFDVYWGAECLDMLLTFMIIQELFRLIFGSYDPIGILSRRLFQWTAIVMVGTSIGIGVFGGHGSESPRVDAFIAMQRSVQILEIGTLFVLIVVCRIFGIVWQRFAFGIVVGLGFALSAGTVVAALRTWMGSAGDGIYVSLEPIAYTLATAIWAFYAVSRDREPAPSSSKELRTKLGEWNHVLQHFRSR
jgi:hypothetical protein